MTLRYTKEDFRRFREICPSNMLFWPDENLAFEMKKRGWKPRVPAISAGQKTADDLFQIDRAERFSPVKFIGQEGWVIEEEDKRSLALVEINLAAIKFEHVLRIGEARINGEDRIRRLKWAGYIRLDAKVIQTLCKNPDLIPESWKKKTKTTLFFDGTILEDPRGRRCVLGIFWRGRMWHWGGYLLRHDWSVNYPSAVLTS